MDAAIILITACVLVLVLCTIAAHINNEQIKKLQRYWDVKIGMSEDKMLDIMGKGYSRSLLKNNRVKYEWRIEAYSYGTSYKGHSTRSYSGVKKVTIYTKNGIVEEVKSHNI